jgi:hypothetical protein
MTDASGIGIAIGIGAGGPSAGTAALANPGGKAAPEQSVDGALHAEPGTMCHACGSEIREKDWIRKGSKGIRHDTCP